MLISRLMKTLDDNDDGSISNDHSKLQNLSSTETYVLRVMGHTTPIAAGVGIGLVLYNAVTNDEIWTGRIYCHGERSIFEADYTAIIMGLDFAKSCGIENLIVQSTNEVVVFQINGIYDVKKESLKPLLAMEKKREEPFSSLSIEKLPSSENAIAVDLATKAIATQKSKNTPRSWKFQDPMTLTSETSEIDEPQTMNDIVQPLEIDPSRLYVLRFDGGSRGNPGVAGYV